MTVFLCIPIFVSLLLITDYVFLPNRILYWTRMSHHPISKLGLRCYFYRAFQYTLSQFYSSTLRFARDREKGFIVRVSQCLGRRISGGCDCCFDVPHPFIVETCRKTGRPEALSTVLVG